MREAVLQERRVRTLGFSIEEGRARSTDGCAHLGVHLGYVDAWGRMGRDLEKLDYLRGSKPSPCYPLKN